MAKDYAKFVPPKPRHSNHRVWRMVLIVVLAFALFCFAMVSYINYAKKSPDSFASNPKVTAFIEKIETTLHHQKKETLAALKTASKVVAKKDAPPPVEFDFYNELPNMQVSLPQVARSSNGVPPVSKSKLKLPAKLVASANANQASVVQQDSSPEKINSNQEDASLTKLSSVSDSTSTTKISSETAGSSQLQINTTEDLSSDQVNSNTEDSAQAEIKPVAESSSSAELTTSEAQVKPKKLSQTDDVNASRNIKAAAPKSLINADEINIMLEAENQTMQHYVLQLGSFDSESAAKVMLSAISGVGFKAEVVKSNKNGHNVYQIQQGPFPNMALAKTNQQKLQKRGIISVIHKTS